MPPRPISCLCMKRATRTTPTTKHSHPHWMMLDHNFAYNIQHPTDSLLSSYWPVSFGLSLGQIENTAICRVTFLGNLSSRKIYQVVVFLFFCCFFEIKKEKKWNNPEKDRDWWMTWARTRSYISDFTEFTCQNSRTLAARQMARRDDKPTHFFIPPSVFNMIWDKKKKVAERIILLNC